MQKITPFLWFNDQAEEAVKFYRSIFKKTRILKVARYSQAGARASGRAKGSVMTIEFELDGQRFVALNGGPLFKFNESISFVVNCKSQAEVDKFWNKLTAGGPPKPVRVAQGQIRSVLANLPGHFGRTLDRQGHFKGRTRHASHAPNAET